MPTSLTESPVVLWETVMARAGLGGIAANEQYVLFGDRDLDDFHDVFRCLDAQTGQERWRVDRLAIAALDYGNSPRATPLIAGDLVYCLGATGNLLCLRIDTGKVLWETNLAEQFPLNAELPWGYCGSPLLIGDRLIINPGTPEASMVAVNARTGDVIWKTPGAPPSYGSLTTMTHNGQLQIVGHDKLSLGGWDPKDGTRLWTVKPERDADFNVPTPVIYDRQLLITTENNGARLFAFDGPQIQTAPVAVNDKLRPDMSTGVVVGDRFFCVNRFLYCLDLKNGLKEAWRIRDSALGDYGSIIASDSHLLVVGKGELLLLKTDGSRDIVARQQIFDDGLPLYSHPALVGNRLYLRGELKLKAIQL